MRMKWMLIFMLAMPLGLKSQDATQIVKINSLTKDLGAIKRGTKVADKFEFWNTSEEDIEIDLVSTCECTTAQWTRGKIKQGEKAEIKFTFDSATKENEETLDIDVYFINKNPKTGNPYSLFLSYTYSWAK